MHGRFSARRITRRKETNTLLRRVRNLTRRIEMIAWSRKALRLKRAHDAGARVTLRGTAALRGSHLRMTAAPRRQPMFGQKPATSAAIRGSPSHNAITMTNPLGKAMPCAAKLVTAFP